MSNTTDERKEGRTVRKHWSEIKPPTARELKAIRRRSKGPIDTSDIPSITEEDLVGGRVRIIKRRPKMEKVVLTIRLDADLVERFKAQGEGYQTRINEALRDYLALEASPESPRATLEKVRVMLDRLARQVA